MVRVWGPLQWHFVVVPSLKPDGIDVATTFSRHERIPTLDGLSRGACLHALSMTQMLTHRKRGGKETPSKTQELTINGEDFLELKLVEAITTSKLPSNLRRSTDPSRP